MSDSLLLDHIYKGLNRLRLPISAEVFEQMLEPAEANAKSHLPFRDGLLQEEVADKEQSRIETAFKIPGHPFRKSINNFYSPYMVQIIATVDSKFRVFQVLK